MMDGVEVENLNKKKIMIKRKLKIKIKAKLIQILIFHGENKMIIKKQIKKNNNNLNLYNYIIK